MKIKSAEAVKPKVVEMQGASGASMRMLIGPDDGAPNFHMRLFEIAPGGHTPRHTHDWEHEVYVLAGCGAVRTRGGQTKLSPADCVLLPANEEHQFLNTGDEALRFLCLVPRESG